MGEEYSNQTLHEILIRVEGRLAEIHDEVKKTNGRVRKLESWRSYIVGAIGILGAIASFTIPIILQNLFK